MDFIKKNWVVLAVALVVLMLIVGRRRGDGLALAAPMGTYVPGTEEPPMASDYLTHQTAGETAGPAVAARSGRGHF